MRKFIQLWLLALLIAVVTPAGAQKANNYKSLSQPQVTEDPDKVEVVEIFWYGCPHCHDFEPYLSEWLQNKPEIVDFKRMPAVFRQNWLPHAKAFYAAEELGVLDKIHEPLFAAIHEQQQPLETEDTLRTFFVDQGVDGDEFTRAFNSGAVEGKVKRSLGMLKRYEVTGVPAVVINGKYITTGPMAGSYEAMIETMNQLIELERQGVESGGSASAE